jgi:hypothetical protein
MNARHNLNVHVYEFDVSDIEKPDVREQIQRCSIILGIDDSRFDKHETCFFVRAILEEISKGRAAEWPEGTEMAKIHYNQETTSLEYLCAAVQVLKGSHEYGGGKQR